MKNGEKIICPNCNETSIVKVRKVMDGWSCVGKEFYCMMCSKSLGEVGEAKSEEKQAEPSKRDRLAEFLGGDIKTTKVVGFERLVKDLRFCKDCVNYIVHPFSARCGLDNQERDPIDDCVNFQRKE